MTCVTSSSSDIANAAALLLEGRLVAFPTETVYGLGANALSEGASVRIYLVKGRPPTDPLICHVPDATNILGRLWDVTTPQNREIAEVGCALGAKFWPGPITFVGPASSLVAPCVTGGCGSVGVRIPDHPVALEFLKACGVPVAAPSANTFGHVSPTCAAHVMSDLAPRDSTLTVIDGGSSSIGIESTVVKLTHNGTCVQLEILRRGKIGVTELQRALKAVMQEKAGSEPFREALVTVRDTRSKFLGNEAVPMDGPGQLLTHYSPNVPSFLVTRSSISVMERSATLVASGGPISARSGVIVAGEVQFPLSRAVLIDFENRVLSAMGPSAPLPEDACAGIVLARMSLSDTGSLDEACQRVFEALRWVETIDGAAVAIFPLLSEWVPRVTPDEERGISEEAADAANELLAAVEDRLFRAASGVVARVEIAA
jgi:L-threonylcarbamoyladenylate synthase